MVHDSYLASHFMARNGDKEEMSKFRIVGPKRTLSDILKEITFAGVLPREFPRRLVKRVRIAVRVHKNPKIPLHRRVVQLENLREMVDFGEGGGDVGDCNDLLNMIKTCCENVRKWKKESERK